MDFLCVGVCTIGVFVWLCVYYSVMMQHRCKHAEFLHHRAVVSGEIFGLSEDRFGHCQTCPQNICRDLFSLFCTFDKSVFPIVIQCCKTIKYETLFIDVGCCCGHK